MKATYFFLFLAMASACHRPTLHLSQALTDQNTPPAPDYSNVKHWAALPDRRDAADSIPNHSNLVDNQAIAQADVFFIHPTIFTQKPENQYQWNADVDDEILNKQVDYSTILNQASVFNGSCRVFAPRYRQAHLCAFYTNDRQTAKKALDIAYTDVKAAFEYYLKYKNDGRPIVIASHSQGTVHAKRLMKEFFDGKPLQKQLVAAYLVGIATPANQFAHIKPISQPGEAGTWASWNTFLQNYTPNYYKDGLNKALCTNPLTWKSDDETFAPKELNKGGVGLKFMYCPQFADAEVHKGMLWINKPYVKGRALVRTKVWHRADINLFYVNIRENVDLQLKNFLKSNSYRAEAK